MNPENTAQTIARRRRYREAKHLKREERKRLKAQEVKP